MAKPSLSSDRVEPRAQPLVGLGGSEPQNLDGPPQLLRSFFVGSRMLFHERYFTCPFASKIMSGL